MEMNQENKFHHESAAALYSKDSAENVGERLDSRLID